MKKFRTLFTLLIIYCFAIFVNAQTTNPRASSNQLCVANSTVTCIQIKSTNVVNRPKKPLTTTKQRRLKNYQSNHKIIRKRKTIKLENVIAAKE